ncbi:RNA polymerase factor sigma-54 [Gottschalkiaceae bacterium SANA]|nr:RNA polymerase factor sigma-54 [Gottschalkiaceae bacterium SANA]
MKLEFGLKLEQKQKLVMTQQLRQAIELLQFNQLQLVDFINQEMDTNPLLEMKEVEQETGELDVEDWKEYLRSNDQADYVNFGSEQRGEDASPFESRHAAIVTLKELLRKQLYCSKLKDEQVRIGEAIIERIDAQGYFKSEMADLAYQIRAYEEEVEIMLYIIQSFDPIGVGARDLSECIELQLRERGIQQTLVYEIVKDELALIAERRYEILAKKFNVQEDEIEAIAELIQSCNPKPGSVYPSEDELVRYIRPDVYVTLGDEGYEIRANESLMPRLYVSPKIQALLKSGEEAEFVKAYLDRALWVVKMIEQRRQTVIRIAGAIVDVQASFFVEGDKGLRPLTMKQVAEEADVHESTVSRVVNGKYMQTPVGLYEMKYFFTTNLGGGEDGVSSKSVQALIREMTEEEDKKKPLSDQKIAEELAKREIKVSRRTVAKYREEMGILSSAKRKRRG